VVKKIDFNTFTPETLDHYLETIEKNVCLVQDNFDRKTFDREYFENDTTKAKIFKDVCENID
jgi:hypothetical protein